MFYIEQFVFQFQFSSVAQLCATLCDPMNHSMPGPPVHHKLPEFTQTHVRRVGDAIHPSHPLLSPSPPAPNPSQHQGLFQQANSLHQFTKRKIMSCTISLGKSTNLATKAISTISLDSQI